MSRPKHQPEPAPADKGWEILAGAGMLALVLLPVLYYNDLPAQIPIHFNIHGKPDGFGSREFIWLLPVIGAALYAGMSFLERRPHKLNFQGKITEENAEDQYRLASRMIRIFKTIGVCNFAFINFIIINISLGKAEGLGPFFLPVFLIITLVPIIWYFWSSSQKPEKDGS